MLQRVTRESSAILGLVTSGLSLAVLFGVNLSVDQMAGIGLFLGALIALLRVINTPASEVVAQQKPGGGAPVAGPASTIQTGTPVVVQAA